MVIAAFQISQAYHETLPNDTQTAADAGMLAEEVENLLGTIDEHGNEYTLSRGTHPTTWLEADACLDLQPVPYPCLWHIAWDPSQPVATRPLAIQMNSTWYCYGWDLTKNICEVFGADGLTKTAYSYTPYGAVTASGTVTQSPRGIGGGLDNSTAVAPQGRTADGAAVSQPIQWSSEFYDGDLGLVYYNYRHYNPNDSKWLNAIMRNKRQNLLADYEKLSANS